MKPIDDNSCLSRQSKGFRNNCLASISLIIALMGWTFVATGAYEASPGVVRDPILFSCWVFALVAAIWGRRASSKVFTTLSYVAIAIAMCQFLAWVAPIRQFHGSW